MEQEKKFYTLIVFSENFAGLLNQVTAVFTRRQVNIESLNVSASSIKGVHKYTITCWSTEEQIQVITKQIEKRIDVLQAHYFTDDEIFIQEVALYKLATPKVLENPDISKAVRQHGAQIVEVNPTYTVVSKKGMTDDITAPRPGSLCGAGSPSTHLLGAPPQTPGDFPVAGKVTKGAPRAAPFGIP